MRGNCPFFTQLTESSFHCSCNWTNRKVSTLDLTLRLLEGALTHPSLPKRKTMLEMKEVGSGPRWRKREADIDNRSF